MRTFIVLIPVGNNNSRKECERIANWRFEKEGSVQLTEIDVKKKVVELTKEFIIDFNIIEVETLSDFMDRVNNQEFNPDDYFMSYVFA